MRLRVRVCSCAHARVYLLMDAPLRCSAAIDVDGDGDGDGDSGGDDDDDAEQRNTLSNDKDHRGERVASEKEKDDAMEDNANGVVEALPALQPIHDVLPSGKNDVCDG